MEFDYELLSNNANIQVQLFDTENDNFTQWLTVKGHYIINVNENNVTWKINGIEQTSKTVKLDTMLIRFYMQSGGEFKFHNFMIYSD